jgi:quinol-cytochrome oxidoreductase complex cytochrome b subunit
VFCLVFGWFVFYEPNALLNPDNYQVPLGHNVSRRNCRIRRNVPYYAILRSIPNKLLGVVAMPAALGDCVV